MKEYPFAIQPVIAVLRQAHVVRAGIFGSMARGDWDAASDVDILVEFAQPVGLFKLVRLKNTLTDLLGREVDLVTPAALSPYLRDAILAETQLVYEAQ